MSKTGRLLGSTEANAIPIPLFGREKATVPWPVKFAPACEIRSLTLVPTGNGVVVSTKHPNMLRFSVWAATCFSVAISVTWIAATKGKRCAR